jgi:hypothetical protein
LIRNVRLGRGAAGDSPSSWAMSIVPIKRRAKSTSDMWGISGAP